MRRRERKKMDGEVSQKSPLFSDRTGQQDESRSLIDTASAHSFPASDPPVWTLGREAHAQSQRDKLPSAEKQTLQQRHIVGSGEKRRKKQKEYVIRRYYAAFQTGNIPQIFDILAPNVKIHIPESLPYGGVYSGHNGFKNLVDKSGALLRMQLSLNQYFDSDAENAFALVTLQAFCDKEQAVPKADIVLLERFRVQDNKIQELWVFYWDTALAKNILETY
jgi:hypothetical protein